jgi:hypothetical protein
MGTKTAKGRNKVTQSHPLLGNSYAGSFVRVMALAEEGWGCMSEGGGSLYRVHKYTAVTKHAASICWPEWLSGSEHRTYIHIDLNFSTRWHRS